MICRIHKTRSLFDKLVPAERRDVISVPDSAPDGVEFNVTDSEELLLVLVQFNRLIDLFFGAIATPIPNPATSESMIIQSESAGSEYVAFRRRGKHLFIRVHAKSSANPWDVDVVERDFRRCKAEHPQLVPKLIAVQFAPRSQREIVMHSLCLENGTPLIVDEMHVRVVRENDIDADDLDKMATHD